MNVTEFFKWFIKLFPLFLIAMLGAGHSVVEARSLIDHTTIRVFGFKYEPTLWSFFTALFVTITALSFSMMIILNLGKYYKKDR